MSDHEVGYGRPPKHSQYPKGVSGNPKGRPKRKPTAAADVIKKTLNAPIRYRERGRTKTMTRAEMGLKKIVDSAVKGDLTAAMTLLRIRASAARLGDLGVETIEVRNWLEDFSEQTAEDRSREFATEKQQKPSDATTPSGDGKHKT